MQGEATLSVLVAVLRARTIRPGPPLVWASEDVDPRNGSVRPAPDGWDQQSGMEKSCTSQSSDIDAEKQQMSEWIICPAFAILLPKPFCMEGLYETQQP